MNSYNNYTKEQLEQLKNELKIKLKKYKAENLDLNMARGKPCTEQLDLSEEMINGTFKFLGKNNFDYRNYGLVDGIPEAKELFSQVLEVSVDEIIIGGNSSLNLMYDSIAKAMLLGTVDSDKAWSKYKNIKFLCPSPGYDRHFAICQELGIEMITIDIDENGPDMDIVEKLVSEDETIKGIWCVPKYANPTGITYSDEVVKRLASMQTAAKDFRIFWDNAYTIHHLNNKEDILLNILDECKKVSNPNRVYMFSSTSKVTFPGAGISMMGASKENIDYLKKQLSIQTIGPNKLNQFMHVHFLKDLDGIKNHMKKHAEIIRPKFEIVLKLLSENLAEKNIATWNEPNGGYFISLNVMEGCAKKVVELAKSIGVTLTSAGATYPYKNDPKDSNIRIAPTYPPIDELNKAIDILCICVELVCIEKILG